MNTKFRDRLARLPADLQSADACVRGTTSLVPRAALVLGSGFSDLLRRVEDSVTIPFEAIPHFPNLGIAGHRGELTFGTLRRLPIVIAGGRKHVYEGEGLLAVLFPVLLLRALGAGVLFLTNAAGGAHADWEVGDVMLIRDHLDTTFHAATDGLGEIAAGSGLSTRPDCAPVQPYSPRLAGLAREAARENAILLREGVYVFSLGPFYETAAEVEALRRLGGDAFGMSTAPEALLAATLGMEVCAFSAITNLATGIAASAHSHADVIRNAALAVPRISQLITAMLDRIADEPTP